MKNLYEKLIDRLASAEQEFTERGLTPLATIDLYDGQPDAPDRFEFVTPALFISYRARWQQATAGTLEIDLHLLLDPVEATENFSQYRTDGLRKLEYYALLPHLIERMQTETTGALTFTGEEPAQTEYFNYHIFHFACSAIRQSLHTGTHATGITPVITLKPKE